ncbi:MAG: hypothetical protein SFT90_04035 [Rickettsiales bacterium]|nr:hypothetical protein [Rickettsiales bacterium]
MKKFLAVNFLIFFLLVQNEANAQLQIRPIRSMCGALDRILSRSPNLRNCFVLESQKAKCKCEASNQRITAFYQFRVQQAQMNCDINIAKRTIRDAERQIKSQCTGD